MGGTCEISLPTSITLPFPTAAAPSAHTALELITVPAGPPGGRHGRPPAGDTGGVPYDPTIYLGSAAHYRHGRPAYSPELEAVLAQEARLRRKPPASGCRLRPRRAYRPPGSSVRVGVGLNPDAGMLAEGRRAAGERGVTNIRWVRGLAEKLPAVAPGPYRLVTFGQSFWWTDEHQVAETVYDMLQPGGALALIVHTVTGRPRPPDPGVPAIPHDEIEALVEKYLGAGRREARAPPRSELTAPRMCWPGPALVLRSSSSSRVSPICCEIARVSCPATCPCRSRRRTCLVIVSTTLPGRCGRCSRNVPPGGFSGTGRATPRWSWPASPADAGGGRDRREDGAAAEAMDTPEVVLAHTGNQTPD